MRDGIAHVCVPTLWSSMAYYIDCGGQVLVGFLTNTMGCTAVSSLMSSQLGFFLALLRALSWATSP